MCINKNYIDLSELSIDEQKSFLDDCYNHLNSLMEKNNTNDKVAIISDTHGDFIAMLTSLLESGIVKIKEGEYTYYDKISQKFLNENEIKEYKKAFNSQDILEYFKIINDKKIDILYNTASVAEEEGLINSDEKEKEYKNIEELINIFKKETEEDKESIEEIKRIYLNEFNEIMRENNDGQLIFKINTFLKNNNIDLSSESGVKDFQKLLEENSINFSKEEIETIYDAIKSNICVIPTPFINKNYKGNFYHLGDIVDRGRESLTSLLFLEKMCDLYKEEYSNKEMPLHIVVGNHESQDTGMGRSYISKINGAEAYKIYEQTLARMLYKGYMSSGYIIGDNKNPTLMTHSAFLESDIPVLFYSFYNLYNIQQKKANENNSINLGYNMETYFILSTYIESLERECKRNNLNNLLEKITLFVENNLEIFSKLLDSKYLFNEEYKKLLMSKIKNDFSIGELIQMRTVMLDSILKMYIDENGKLESFGKINSEISGSNGLKDSLLKKFGKKSIDHVSIGFWQRIINSDLDEDALVCNQCLGHEALNFNTQSTLFESDGIFKRANFFDSSRSYCSSHRKSSSLPLTTYYSLENGNISLDNPYLQTSYEIIRKNTNQINEFREVNSTIEIYNDVNKKKLLRKIYYNGNLIANREANSEDSSDLEVEDVVVYQKNKEDNIKENSLDEEYYENDTSEFANLNKEMPRLRDLIEDEDEIEYFDIIDNDDIEYPIEDSLEKDSEETTEKEKTNVEKILSQKNKPLSQINDIDYIMQ